MKKYTHKAALALCALGLTSVTAFAGNKDRTGQAGASELLINPWAKSSGVFGLDASHVKGAEAMKVNIAGLAYTNGTEIGLSYTQMLRGSNVSIANLGFAQSLGKLGVIGVNIMSTNFGEIPITTTNNPTGGIGTYKPQFLNFSLGFAKNFDGVTAGINVTFVNEQLTNVRASGAAFDAGVQYNTGKRDNFHVGIALRNMGTSMRFSGAGFAISAEAPANQEVYDANRETPTEKFEMPTYLNLGVSYDFYLDENRLKDPEHDKPKHRATAMANFTSNSFLNDYLGIGLEYAFMERFMVRGAYRYEKDLKDNSFYTGIAAGATVVAPIGKNGPRVGLDYSFRPTQRPNNGVHVFSLRFMSK